MGTPVASLDHAERVAAIEQAFETHWRHFGLYPDGRLRDEDGCCGSSHPFDTCPTAGASEPASPGTGTRTR